MIAQVLANVLRRRMLVAASELELQTLIASALTDEGITYVRERRLGPTGVIDFYLPDGCIGVEVKVDGAPSAVGRQLMRYALSSDVDELVLVTTRATHLSLRGRPLMGKAVHVVQVVSGL